MAVHAVAASSPGAPKGAVPAPLVSYVAAGTAPGPTTRLVAFIDAVGRISTMSLAIEAAANASILRDSGMPEANPLNDEATA